MFLYWTTLVIGILLIIYALIKVGKEKKQSNSEEDTNKKNKLLVSEVIEELHENTENIMEKFSEREEKLETLLEQADRKIEELNYELEKKPIIYTKTDVFDATLNNKSKANKAYNNNNTDKSIEVDGKTINEGDETVNQDEAKVSNDYSNEDNVLPFPSYQRKYPEIKELYKKGFSITEIAKQTGKDKGEVQLILNLINKDEESNNNEMGC
ncbi:DUF6115 domain-containing protein [Natranaerofaba carboxydovora]|uniref:DUF6115 domain-containing protein n=1 Tax=Natranaerofaba carboxydovora TaxID=2742683 RepID=UPI001F141362|nr:hypothetical protein [Natranaerofaba carboxydovora]UMZ73391.1 hypothetical protein ACONDI_00945 [Natranaerofaba carboxydovora]